MNWITRLLLICCTAFCMTSCMDIYQDVTIRKDDSAEVKFTVDMSKALKLGSGMFQYEEMVKDVGKSFKLGEGFDYSAFNERKVFTQVQIDSFFDSVVTTVEDESQAERMRAFQKELKGAFMEVSGNKEAEELALGFGFQIQHVNDFSEMMALLQDGSFSKSLPGGQSPPPGTQLAGAYDVKYNGTTLKIKDPGVDFDSNPFGSDTTSKNTIGMLQGIDYITRYHFPKKVDEVSSDDAMISNKGYTVEQRSTLYDMYVKGYKFDNTIKLKKK